MSILIACLLIGAWLVGAVAWAQVQKRRDEREAAESAFQQRVAAMLEFADELCADAVFAFEYQLTTVLESAAYLCRVDAHEQGLLPPADPGDPWQSRRDADASPHRLVDRSDSDD